MNTTIVHDALFKLATRHDGFRLWYYPYLPFSYSTNERLHDEIEKAFKENPNLSEREIADVVFRSHA